MITLIAFRGQIIEKDHTSVIFMSVIGFVMMILLSIANIDLFKKKGDNKVKKRVEVQ